jgi:hypothetical protein
MSKVFQYRNSRKRKDETIFTSVYAKDFEALATAIEQSRITACCIYTPNEKTVTVVAYAAHDISRYLIRNGWSLGV